MSSIHVKSNLIIKVIEVWKAFLSLFYPDYCVGCSRSLIKGEEILCTHCLLELPKTNHLTEPENSMKLRLSSRIPVCNAFAYLKFRKTGVVQHLLHQLKYNGHPEVGVRLGKILGRELINVGFENQFDLIIPIPLHKTKKQRRGYNQSAKFAEGLSLSLNIPFDDSIVVRISKTSTQTRKTKLERWENVKDVFKVKTPTSVNSKRILLVDDVMTTGATLEACANKLYESGCQNVSVACIAEA